jgi:hypothetical protein
MPTYLLAAHWKDHDKSQRDSGTVTVWKLQQWCFLVCCR